MRANTQIRMASAALLLLGGVPGLSAQGHHPGPPVGAPEQQKQKQMQQHMAGMQDMMQRMGTMMQRSQQMSAHMTERMRQMPAGQMAEQHRAMQQMSEHMATAGGHMRGLMEQMDAMMGDHGMLQAPGMQKDLNEMHKQMKATTTSMEKMLQAMERMGKRIGAGTPVPPKP